MTVRPDSRLLSAAAYVRQGAVLADIGTDHAHLPVFLWGEGRLRGAYACDVAEGPCERARRNIAAAGLADKISVIMTDGMTALDGLGITDYAVCGMGGDLIASLIDRAPHLKDPALRLILLPMTHADRLRAYLAEQGFVIEEETLSQAAGKRYACLCASYTGEPYALSLLEACFGRYNLDRPSEILLAMIRKKEQALRTRLSAVEDGEAARLLAQIERYLYDRTIPV